MAKLTRESRLRERRMEKQAKKIARKLDPGTDAEAPEQELHGDPPRPDAPAEAHSDESAQPVPNAEAHSEESAQPVPDAEATP